MLGRESPITSTSLRPACRIASPAPVTAGAEMAMISFTCGYTFKTVCVSAKALSRSSSLGRMVASFRAGYLPRRFLMNAIHSF